MNGTRRRSLALLLAGVLAGAPAAAQKSPDGELAGGIAFVKAGDFEAAIPPLSAAIQALSADLKRRQELARAYLYLGVAYLELNQELEARGKFREALRNDAKIQLSPKEFSDQVRRVFEAERLAALEPKSRRRQLLPFVLVLGGGAAASVAVAAARGADPPAETIPTPTTTTTTMSGGPGPTTTTTTTAPPGPGPSTTTTTTTTTTTSTTTPGPTTTTTPGATTTTTTPTTTTTTTTTTTPTTTTTTMPSCSYMLNPDRTFNTLGGMGVCNVMVTPNTCPWTAQVEYQQGGSGWITLTGNTSGNGDAVINYTVAALGLASRLARIRVAQDPNASCAITQALLSPPEAADQGFAWTSRLELAGGRGQVFVNGTDGGFQEGAQLGRGRLARGALNRVEAQLVRGGRPGTWTFDLLSGHQPGSLRAVAGQVALVASDRIVFQLSGAPGERVAFVFRAAR
jgi:hypothetical protein